MRFVPKGVLALSLVLGLVALPLALSPAMSSASHVNSEYPLTLKAADGTYTFTKKPSAIISLSPTATEMLFAIGAGPQVKAVDSDSDYPTNAPITKLSAYTPNVEAIAKYKPDLVVVEEATANFDKQMAALKIPVVIEPTANNLKQAYAQYTSLGIATGDVTGAAKEVATIKAKIASIVQSTPKAKKGSTYYFELDPTYYSVTSSTFVGQLFHLLGLTSIADNAKGAAADDGYPQLSSEFILKANPTYIFLADTICCKATKTSVSARPGWSALTAVRDGRIIPLSDDIASRWGPRITILLQDAANAIKDAKASSSS